MLVGVGFVERFLVKLLGTCINLPLQGIVL